MKVQVLKKIALAVLAGAAIMLVSWKGSSTAGPNKFTDEEVFRGLMFMKGQVANQIPQLQEKAVLMQKLNQGKQDQQAIDELQDKILMHIKANKPNYLSSFASTMKSGNHYAISNKLKEGGEVITDALFEMLHIDMGDAQSKKEAINKLMGSKMEAIRGLYTKFKTGEMSAEAFKKANQEIMADKTDDLLKLFPALAANGNTASVNDGKCVAVTVAAGLAVAVYLAVAVTAGAIVNVAVAINVGLFINAASVYNVAASTYGGNAYYKNYIVRPVLQEEQQEEKLEEAEMVNTIALRLQEKLTDQ